MHQGPTASKAAGGTGRADLGVRARDKKAGVRAGVAGDPSTPPETLRAMTTAGPSCRRRCPGRPRRPRCRRRSPGTRRCGAELPPHGGSTPPARERQVRRRTRSRSAAGMAPSRGTAASRP
ncbi:hypothetical protein [Nonomuraea ceibae]|uniref:hypothetical protein n=1 Tax=Nonomuraea ceibae TaxID=1935170 RepID=UPI0035579A2D